MFRNIKKELFFSDDEYQLRLQRTRRLMEERQIETLLCFSPENIYYISGYQTFGFHNFQVLVLPIEGSPFLVLKYLESALAHQYSVVSDVVTWEDTDDPVDVTLRELGRRRLSNRTIGIEERGFFLQVSTWRRCKEAIPRLVDGSGIVETLRAIKSEREIAYMRQAARLTDLGITEALNTIAAGVSENDVAAAAFAAMTKGGSEYLTRDPIVTSGERSGVPHTCYYRRTLTSGDAVLIELSGVFNRYYSPLMRSALVGTAPSEVEKLAPVALEALNAAIDSVGPGVAAGEVDAAATRVIARHGCWENYRRSLGYSVGIGFSSWVEGGVARLKQGTETVLAEGMCFHMPVALRLYGVAGIGFSETVHVTRTGHEVLGRMPRELLRC